MITCLWCKLDCVADLRAENYLLCPSESCLLPLFVLLFVLVQVHSGSEFSTEGLSGEKSLFFFFSLIPASSHRFSFIFKLIWETSGSICGWSARLFHIVWHERRVWVGGRDHYPPLPELKEKEWGLNVCGRAWGFALTYTKQHHSLYINPNLINFSAHSLLVYHFGVVKMGGRRR